MRVANQDGGGSSGGRGGTSSGGGSSGGRGGSSGGSGGSSGGRGGGSSYASLCRHALVLFRTTQYWPRTNVFCRSGRSSGTSSTGGRTSAGSGPAPSYGGGRYYGGGAQVPYRSAGPSPSGLLPVTLGAGAALAFWPGLWYHPAYLYHTNPYSYYNESNKKNETKPVVCACDETVECGCDNNTDTTYLGDLIGNGSYSALNQSQVTVADYQGTSTILVNGTLPNGTTASGGTDDDSAGVGMRALLEAAGFWPAVASVCVMVFLA